MIANPRPIGPRDSSASRQPPAACTPGSIRAHRPSQHVPARPALPPPGRRGGRAACGVLPASLPAAAATGRGSRAPPAQRPGSTPGQVAGLVEFARYPLAHPRPIAMPSPLSSHASSACATFLGTPLAPVLREPPLYVPPLPGVSSSHRDITCRACHPPHFLLAMLQCSCQRRSLRDPTSTTSHLSHTAVLRQYLNPKLDVPAPT